MARQVGMAEHSEIAEYPEPLEMVEMNQKLGRVGHSQNAKAEYFEKANAQKDQGS